MRSWTGDQTKSVLNYMASPSSHTRLAAEAH